MKMKKAWIFIGIIGIAVIIWLFAQNPMSVKPPSAKADIPTEVAGEERIVSDGSNTQSTPQSSMVIPVHPMAASLGTASIPPEREPEILFEILEAYRRVTGSFPVAEDNRHMMTLLTSGLHSMPGVFPQTHPRRNAGGEITDGWGTPYFFHHISSQQIEVRSAGPDRIFYTPDDIIVPRRT